MIEDSWIQARCVDEDKTVNSKKTDLSLHCFNLFNSSVSAYISIWSWLSYCCFSGTVDWCASNSVMENRGEYQVSRCGLLSAVLMLWGDL